MKFISMMLIAAIIGLVSQGTLLAQAKPTKQEQKAVEVKEKIAKLGTGSKAVVKATLYSGTAYQGFVSSAGQDDFVIVDKAGTSTTVKYSDVNKIGGKNMSTGAKIAIGIGIGAGATLLILWAIFENYG
jgi:hypothetical protein